MSYRIILAVGIVLIAPCALCSVSLPVVPQPPQTTTLVITATATDGSGNTSSAQMTITVVRSNTLQYAKSIADGNAVQLSGLVATTSSSDFKGVFYAEHADRSSGIGVMWKGSVSRGDVVSITGMMLTIHGERFVLARTVQIASGSP